MSAEQPNSLINIDNDIISHPYNGLVAEYHYILATNRQTKQSYYLTLFTLSSLQLTA